MCVRVHSSAPTRIDLAGGTLDIWPLYLFHDNAQTLNVAITRRAECRLEPRNDGRLGIFAEDTGAVADVEDVSKLDDRAELRLITRIGHYFGATGMTISTRSGSPVGAGLAGSSALNIALCAALARWRDCDIDPEALIKLALDLEAQVIAVPTGAQDYRPATYGGVAALELRPGGVVRVPLKVDVDALADRIVLVFSGQSRDSGINNWKIMKRHIDGDQNVIDIFDEIRDVAVAMRHALEIEQWDEVGRYIDLEWELRKRLDPCVTTDRLESLIYHGRRAGALAARVCGSGGGGCVAFLAQPDATNAIRRSLKNAGAHLLDCRVDTEGVLVTVEVNEPHG